MTGSLLENLTLGFAVALSFHGILYCGFGVLLGTVVGVLPGLGSMATLAMLMPITYHIDPSYAVIMLAGIYYGAAYGGSTASILLNMPGTVTSVVTGFDGYPMSQNGKAGVALFMTAIASFVGSMIGAVMLAVLTVPLAGVAMQFGPQEYFMLMTFALVAASLLSSRQPIKSLITVVFGILLGIVGLDLNSGAARFTFNTPELFDGLPLVALALGLFGLPEIIATSGGGPDTKMAAQHVSLRSMLPSREEWKRSILPMLRGTGIGAFFGALPGTGGTIATFMSYTLEKRVSRHPERFGKGAIEGVAAPESANNAAIQTAFIPTMSLGIPGDAVMAMILGVLIVHGVIPGPLLITDQPQLFWGMVASFVIGNILLVVLNIPLVGLWVRLLRVPYPVLFPIMLALLSVGIYSIRNSVTDIYMLVLFGGLGIGLRLLRFDGSTLLLGFVLGPMIEENFRRSMVVSMGDYTTFLERPISAVFGLFTLAFLLIFGVKSLAKLLRTTNRGGVANISPSTYEGNVK
ncbi:tripartite tricarboxylate transporter permease [Sulfitobacter sp. W074]|uniref:tripartite tricarboxylate transporter permease n=1 Tax=Sulfitobacter sp. W074 TaxID=2867026 RepID=UPI0021A30621|nr:tripartite tricarboxylate transporter permease [Sulfitobacter sp. W074]UWR39508.1 tripartite tricarboxylate transporter permease [Sulfitobacter sp. W074]